MITGYTWEIKWISNYAKNSNKKCIKAISINRDFDPTGVNWEPDRSIGKKKKDKKKKKENRDKSRAARIEPNNDEHEAPPSRAKSIPSDNSPLLDSSLKLLSFLADIRSSIERQEKSVQILEQNINHKIATQGAEIDSRLEAIASTISATNYTVNAAFERVLTALNAVKDELIIQNNEAARQLAADIEKQAGSFESNLKGILGSLGEVSAVLEALADQKVEARPSTKHIEIRSAQAEQSKSLEKAKERELLDIIRAITLFQNKTTSESR